MILEIDTPLNTIAKSIGVRLDLSETAQKWLAKEDGTHLELLDILKLKVNQIRLKPRLMEKKAADDLKMPRHPPYIQRCPTLLTDYIDVSCSSSNEFYEGEGNRYFLLISFKLSQENCWKLKTFVADKGSTTFKANILDGDTKVRVRRSAELIERNKREISNLMSHCQWAIGQNSELGEALGVKRILFVFSW